MKKTILFISILINTFICAEEIKSLEICLNPSKWKKPESYYKIGQIKSDFSQDEKLEVIIYYGTYWNREKTLRLFLKKKENANFEFMAMQIKKAFDITRANIDKEENKNSILAHIDYNVENSVITSISEDSGY